MTPAEPRRFCCVCKKLFCCARCRERHEKNKHANHQLNCPFCTSQRLPLKSFDDTALFCHIVITHLPLYCTLCGETFKQSKDLESFGTCKWWKYRQLHSLACEEKSMLGTPPMLEEKRLSEYNGSITSPPELYRNTSTPMGVCQKTSHEFITPNVPNFSLQTPQTDSASLKKDLPSSDFQGSKAENTASNYLSFPSTINHDGTPFRSLSSHNCKDEQSKGNTKSLNTMDEQDEINAMESNDDTKDMELTGVEDKILPDSQGLELCQTEKRSEPQKKVRFSDQYEEVSQSINRAVPDKTETEEYYEACDTLSEIKEPLEKSQLKIREENIENDEKENYSPAKANENASKAVSGSSRVVMMVVVENNSTVSTSDVIESSLKKLTHLTSNKASNGNHSSPGCSSSITSVDSYYSMTSRKSDSSPIESKDPIDDDSNSSTTSNDSTNSRGILSVVANAVRNVMRNLPGVGTSRNIERERYSRSIVSRVSTFDSVGSGLDLQRSGKRPREISESPSSRRQTEVSAQLDFRSPLPKRPRGWYRIKGREPIARMRNNNRITSPRGVSLETQVFHQGSLSVGDTVLPLPSRAHQSTQTEQ